MSALDPTHAAAGEPDGSARPGSAFATARVSLSEAVARELEREIVSGNRQPGERLGTKDELRLRFGVALATINDAIRQLEMRGLLKTRPGPGGGVFITDVSTRVRLNQFVMGYKWGEATVADHHAVRNALEPLVCREAARYHTAADIRALKALLKDMRAHLSEPLPYLRGTWALHRRIAEMGRNFPLRSIYLTILDFLEDSVDRVEIDEFDARQHLERHHELVAALDEGLGERLDAAIRAHEIQPLFVD